MIMMSEKPKKESKPKFDIERALEGEKRIQPITQDLVLCIFNRSGEHGERFVYYNPTSGERRTEDKSRIFGVGITSNQISMFNMTRMGNERRIKYKNVPIRKKIRNPITGKLEWRKYLKKEPCGFTFGYENIARHLSKFIPISAEQVEKLIEPYKDAQRVFFFTKYEGLGVCIHGQPSNIEDFMGFKNHWIVKATNNIPTELKTERRFLWLNARLKELQKSLVEKGSGYWQVRI